MSINPYFDLLNGSEILNSWFDDFNYLELPDKKELWNSVFTVNDLNDNTEMVFNLMDHFIESGHLEWCDGGDDCVCHELHDHIIIDYCDEIRDIQKIIADKDLSFYSQIEVIDERLEHYWPEYRSSNLRSFNSINRYVSAEEYYSRYSNNQLQKERDRLQESAERLFEEWKIATFCDHKECAYDHVCYRAGINARNHKSMAEEKYASINAIIEVLKGRGVVIESTKE